MQQASDSVQLIFGLGKTGLSCAEYFNDRNMPFLAMDSRDSAPYAKQISQLEYCHLLYCGDPDQNIELMQQYLNNVSQVIVSPGVATTGSFFALVKQQNIEIIGDIELFARQVSAPVVAITGSNGKSTVTELTGELLRAAGYDVLIGGNIGIPVLQLLKQKVPDFYVLELSSFQLETTRSLQPVAGTVLNLSADHMDRYESFEDYAAVKMALLENCKLVVINRDEFPHLQAKGRGQTMAEITIALRSPANYRAQQQDDGSFWIEKADCPLLDTAALKIPGLHNISNAMAALALCEASGVAIDKVILEKLQQWPGLPHRCEYLGERQGVRIYNDSKATNVGATLAALKGLADTISGDLVLIAGGDGKGSDFKPLASAFKRYLSALVLIGKDAERLLEEAGQELRSVIVADMKQAVSAAFSFANKGDAILLSPACASLDMYKNFEHRGDCFSREVEALI